MISREANNFLIKGKPVVVITLVLMIIGFGTFIIGLAGQHPERAWQGYLINVLIWSAVAQGGLLFSMVTHITKARWSRPLQSIAESFVAFFPVSFALFLILFLGRGYLFPWLHEDLHGKKVWLNMPFLFSRDMIGLFILYGLGLGYVYQALRLRLDKTRGAGRIRAFVCRNWTGSDQERLACRSRLAILGTFYILAYTLVLTLIAFDLVMSMDPHWYSTLFGPYYFVKAFYIGLGALIILAAAIHVSQGKDSALSPSHFHDIGKLFFAFGLLWADFFYAQLLVIWYGNIPEETSFVIARTVALPWKALAWTVFIVSFIVPFLILLNRNVKTKPVIMIVLCSVVLIGIWLEQLLLLGPSLNPETVSLPLNLADLFMTMGFLGLMVLAVTSFLRVFPELGAVVRPQEVG